MAETETLEDILKHIDKRDIAEVKSFLNPPQSIKDAFAATALLLGHPEKHVKDWKFVKSLLGGFGEQSLQSQLTKFDINSLSPEVTLKAKEIIDDIDVDMVKTISLFAHTLCRWNEQVVSTKLDSTEGEKS